jgi:hypothetical protein
MRRWMLLLGWAGCAGRGCGWADHDGDGYPARIDCDDQDPRSHPGARDVPYDGADQDCDGSDLVDVDGDGHDGLQAGGDDCDDRERAAHPGAQEIWYDGIDGDCDGRCDYDQDGDGAIIVGVELWLLDDTPCDSAEGKQVRVEEDCDDTDPLVVERGMELSADSEEPHDPVEPLFLRLLQQATAPEIALATASGQPVPLSLEQSDEIYLLGTEGPLLPATEYLLTVTDSCGTRVMGFTTAPAGEVPPARALVGRTWRVDASSMGLWNWSVLDTFLRPAIEPLYLSVTGVAGEALDLRLAASRPQGERAVQDLCLPTVELTGVPLEGGFALWLRDIELPMSFGLGSDQASVVLQQASLGAHVQESGLTALWFEGIADTRPLSGEYICAQAASWEEPCGPCPDGSGDYCLPTNLYTSMEAWEHDLALVGRTQAEIDLDPTCP